MSICNSAKEGNLESGETRSRDIISKSNVYAYSGRVLL